MKDSPTGKFIQWQVNTEASYHESLQDASPDVRLSA